ncbi:hypothetical protein D3C73_1528550 [compost metagenome]
MDAAGELLRPWNIVIIIGTAQSNDKLIVFQRGFPLFREMDPPVLQIDGDGLAILDI